MRTKRSPSPPLPGHAFRSRRVTGPDYEAVFLFSCECGRVIGRQTEIGHMRARTLHRNHKSELRDEDGES